MSVEGPPPEASAGPPPPPALVASCVLGVIGFVILLGGLVLDNVPLAVGGVALGSLSLGAALVWRSQLIEAWRRQRGQEGGGRR